jgi:predicted nuclease of predicted toxin-antitoxin system
MTARILADENVDHRVVHRLENYGYDIEHVDFASGLEKGSGDTDVADYSLETERLFRSH